MDNDHPVIINKFEALSFGIPEMIVNKVMQGDGKMWWRGYLIYISKPIPVIANDRKKKKYKYW